MCVDWEVSPLPLWVFIPFVTTVPLYRGCMSLENSPNNGLGLQRLRGIKINKQINKLCSHIFVLYSPFIPQPQKKVKICMYDNCNWEGVLKILNRRVTSWTSLPVLPEELWPLRVSTLIPRGGPGGSGPGIIWASGLRRGVSVVWDFFL